MTDDSDAADRGAAARRLIRSGTHAALGTSLDGRPYVSLVATACAFDASPLLLLSDLAQHTRNLRADPRVSLLFADVAGHADPLAARRLSLVGRAERLDDAAEREAAARRFTARHPASADYLAFGDFHLYRIVIERGHFVAGFGRIAWIEASGLRLSANAAALADAEAGIVEHMNRDHAAALQLYAEYLLHAAGSRWIMTGLDPEGADLQCPTETGVRSARLDFPELALTSATARRILVSLADRAREIAQAR